MRKQSDSDVFNCIICKEDRCYFSMGCCEHSKVCLFCCLRSRILYKDKKCPICTTKLDEIFIFEANEIPSSFAEIEASKKDYYQDDEFQENGIYYGTISAHEEALNLRGFKCPIKACQDGAFDNLQTLSTHLNKVHKRYYCETCLKEGKRFLSEMPIYTYEGLSEHVAYGEYSEKGSLIVPPHPVCSFCNIKFFNDEHLFKHMNEQHFICQLCRDKKNIIFYKELSQLLEHYKFMHYVCPYDECIQDMFVVFESEEKLNSHLITRHKCQDAHNKITNFMFDNKSKKQMNTNNYNKFSNKDEFNFSSYVNELKERVKEHQERMKNKPVYVKHHENEYNQSNYGYQDGPYYEDQSGYGNRKKGRGKGKDQRYGSSSQDYYQQGQGQGQQQRQQAFPLKKPTTTDDLFNTAIEYIRVPENVNQNYNYGYQGGHQGGYQQSYDDNYSYQNNRNNQKKSNNAYGYNKQKGGNKFNKDEEERTNNLLKVSENTSKAIGKTDYAFLFNNYAKIIKEYISNKVKNENPKEEEFLIPRETIYQLIIIIDKLGYEKLFELSSLANFGIDLDIHRELKNVLAEGLVDQQKIWYILDKLEIKKLLILYKYISISAKKIDGLFYKLELEQIDPDMYDDFGVRDKKYRKPIFSSNKENTQTKQKPKDNYNSNKIKNKLKFDDNQFPRLSNHVESPDNIRKGNSKLSAILGANQPKTTTNANVNLDLTNAKSTPEVKFEAPKGNKQQSKLAMALEGKIVPRPEPKKSDWGEKRLNKNKINYDEEFPEL